MIVKCKECGKEYQLKFTENYRKFQCECGGDLRTLKYKEISQRNKKEKQTNIPSENASQSTNKQEYNPNYIPCQITEYSKDTFGGESPHTKNGSAYLTDTYMVLRKNKGIVSSSKEINIGFKDITGVKFQGKGLFHPALLKIYTTSKKYKLGHVNENLLNSFYLRLRAKINH